MSASPPPPPPPYTTFPKAGPATGWDRRAMRAQRRAAVLQARHQSALERAQLRAGRRTSVLGPVLLVAIGITFLLIETGRVPPAGATVWLSHWWPLILVAGGFVLLLEWALDAWISAQRGVSAPRRRVGGGTGFLLVLLVLVGIALMSLQNRPEWMTRNWNPEIAESFGLDHLFLPHTETQQDLSAPLAPRGMITIRNYRGNITITGSSQDGQVHVSARQWIAAWQGSELKAKQKRDRLVLQQDGNGLLLKANGEGRDRTDLTIEVPHESGVTIEPEKGEVNVSELRGPLIINEHTGNITLAALTGDAHLTVRDDNAAISVHSFSGEFTLQGRSGDLAFSDVSGPLHLQGDFFGTTHLERIKGPVHFESSFTDFACIAIPGELNVEGRDQFEADGLEGPVLLHTSDRNLTLTNLRSGVTLDDRNGSVTLSLANPIGPVKVNTTAASIDVQVPERANFTVFGETSGGQLTNDLGLTSERQGERLTLSGKIRTGGPEISLRTTDGDIRIHKGTESAQSDEAQKSPDPADAPPAEDSHLGAPARNHNLPP